MQVHIPSFGESPIQWWTTQEENWKTDASWRSCKNENDNKQNKKRARGRAELQRKQEGEAAEELLPESHVIVNISSWNLLSLLIKHVFFWLWISLNTFDVRTQLNKIHNKDIVINWHCNVEMFHIVSLLETAYMVGLLYEAADDGQRRLLIMWIKVCI